MKKVHWFASKPRPLTAILYHDVSNSWVTAVVWHSGALVRRGRVLIKAVGCQRVGRALIGGRGLVSTPAAYQASVGALRSSAVFNMSCATKTLTKLPRRPMCNNFWEGKAARMRICRDRVGSTNTHWWVGNCKTIGPSPAADDIKLQWCVQMRHTTSLCRIVTTTNHYGKVAGNMHTAIHIL